MTNYISYDIMTS